MKLSPRLVLVYALAEGTLSAQVPPAAPQITSEPPRSLVGVRGEPLLNGPRGEWGLTVFATGTAPIAAEWFKDGQSVAGGSLNFGVTSYRIDVAQSSDAGDYYVVLTNALGTVTSSVVNVRIVEPLLIVAQPQSVVRAPGATMAFSVTATGEEPISYQWLRESGEAVAGATGSTLRVTLLPDQAPFAYYVVVSNPWQTLTSARASAALVRPPVITRELPTELLLSPSFLTSVRLEYEVPATATVEWRKNGALIPGETNTGLVLVSTGGANVADYTAKVTNAVGTVTGQTCRVISMPAMRFARQPADARAHVGQNVTLSVDVTGGHEPYAFQWYTNTGETTNEDGKMSGAFAATLVLQDLRPEHARRYVVRVTDASGASITSDPARVTVDGVASASLPPVLLVEPEPPLFGAGVGSFHEFTAVAAGATRWAWLRNGIVIAGATNSRFSLRDLTPAVAGDYVVTASNAAGTVASRPVYLSVLPRPGLLPSFLASTQTVVAGTHVHISAGVTGANPIRYQWRLNGANLPGQTSQELAIFNATTADAGVYTAEAAADVGTLVTNPQTLVVKPPIARVTNASVRTVARSGTQSLIAGFSIVGIGSKSLLIRGIGPALAEFGVTSVLPDPELVVTTQAGRPLANGREYNGDPLLADTFVRAGAFPLGPSARDVALVLGASPASYSVRVASRSNAPGVALAELYDLDPPSASARIGNVSVRAQLEPATPLVVGFSVAGDGPLNVLVRAIGPTLAQFGIPDALADLTLELHTTIGGQDRVIARNEAWGGSAVLTGAFSRLGAFPLGALSQDCAMLAALQDGSYTLVVTGRDGATGVVLAEVYVFQ